MTLLRHGNPKPWFRGFTPPEPSAVCPNAYVKARLGIGRQRTCKRPDALFRGASIASESDAGFNCLRGGDRRRSRISPIPWTTNAVRGPAPLPVCFHYRLSGIRTARQPYLSGPRCEVAGEERTGFP